MSTQLNTSSTAQMEQIFEKQQLEFSRRLPIDNTVRVDRLNRAISLLADNSVAISDAIQADWARPEIVNLLVDVADPVGRLRHAIKNVSKWTKAEKRSPSFPFGLVGGRATVEHQPIGCVGIISPWNAPVMLSFGPLAAAFAAGNSAMIKPSEYLPTLSELLKNLVSGRFDDYELAVITGGVEVGQAFSKLPFAHLAFTGGGEIAKKILHSAADNLTPVTLELGGKSPVVIADDANLELASRRIMTGKLLNGGQICVNADYLFLPKNKLESFIDLAKQVAIEQYPDLANNQDYCSIVHQNHFDRLQRYIDDAQSKNISVISVAETTEDMRAQLKMSPHIFINPPEESLIMQEEIFGPFLIIKTYEDEDEVITYIKSRPHPLASYYFGADSNFRRRMLQGTIAGDTTINDILSHSIHPDFSFGGVGASGSGSLYGIEGFRRFSHARTIYQQTPIDKILTMARPPFTQKTAKFVNSMIGK